MKLKLPKFSFNAPVIIIYTIASAIVLMFDTATGGESTKAVFTCFKSDWTDPMMYLRMITYVFGHSDYNHFFGNFTMIILAGPMLEEKYGSKRLLLMMLVTSLIGGLANVLIGTHGLVGGSGIVFLFIILASCTSVKEGAIPMTMALVAIFYIGREVMTGLTTDDTISQLTHILGGICGVVFGLYFNDARLAAPPKKKKS